MGSSQNIRFIPRGYAFGYRFIVSILHCLKKTSQINVFFKEFNLRNNSDGKLSKAILYTHSEMILNIWANISTKFFLHMFKCIYG